MTGSVKHLLSDRKNCLFEEVIRTSRLSKVHGLLFIYIYYLNICNEMLLTSVDLKFQGA